MVKHDKANIHHTIPYFHLFPQWRYLHIMFHPTCSDSWSIFKQHDLAFIRLCSCFHPQGPGMTRWLKMKRCHGRKRLGSELHAFSLGQKMARPSHWIQTRIWHPNLVGGLEHLDYFSIISGIILPIDFHIFQRGRSTTNQQCLTNMIALWLLFMLRCVRCFCSSLFKVEHLRILDV